MFEQEPEPWFGALDVVWMDMVSWCCIRRWEMLHLHVVGPSQCLFIVVDKIS